MCQQQRNRKPNDDRRGLKQCLKAAVWATLLQWKFTSVKTEASALQTRENIHNRTNYVSAKVDIIVQIVCFFSPTFLIGQFLKD